jgi:CO/xanthine dehydrogenase Mo-binding subunit
VILEALRVVGRPVPRKDAADIVTANVSYAADVSFPGMLHGRLVRSPIASGRVIGIDALKARELRGVKAVIAADDVPLNPFGYGIKDERIFVSRIRYCGEVLAAVAATDEETAERAVKLVEVKYEEIPGVFDVLDAIKPDAPLVHEELGSYRPNSTVGSSWNPRPGTNILHEIESGRGDVEKGFADADYVFEDTFRTRRVQHCYLEPHACVAKVEGDTITVWTTTQKAFVVRSALAEIFAVPESSIRVICTKIGGGFGGKNGIRIEHYAVALAKKTGKPVKITMTRDEEFTSSAGSVPAAIVMKTGVKRDGTMIARQVRFLWDCGAYSEGLPASNRAIKDGTGPYRIPNLKVTSTLVYTNTMRGCPFRGLGCPESTWAGESQMDMIAERLGLDPVEIRMKNLVQDGDPAATPEGEILEGVRARECLARAAESIGYNTRAGARARCAVGFSMIYKSPTSASGAVSTATVCLNRDGSVHVTVGSSDVGGGFETVIAQIAAETFGIDYSDVNVVMADTDMVPFDHGTYSSRATVSTGLAVLDAAEKVKRQLLETAGGILAEAPSNLFVREKCVIRIADGKRTSIADILNSRRAAEKALTATGFSNEDGTKGWRFGAQAVEVEVDRETGVVRVLKVVSAQDVGTAVNPPLIEGQLEGGVVMGLGYALGEELVLDEGKTINPTFSDYRIPFAQDIPPIELINLESPLPQGPFGAKGIGELGNFGIAPAIANAIHKAAGVRLTEIPMTPERVLAALEAQDRQTAKVGQHFTAPEEPV